MSNGAEPPGDSRLRRLYSVTYGRTCNRWVSPGIIHCDGWRTAPPSQPMLCDYCENPITTAPVTVVVRNRLRQLCGLSCAVNYLEDWCGRYGRSPRPANPN